jgi:hypothetical protein
MSCQYGNTFGLCKLHTKILLREQTKLALQGVTNTGNSLEEIVIYLTTLIKNKSATLIPLNTTHKFSSQELQH